METRVTRILLTGSQTIFRTGLRRLLAREPDLKIVGEAAGADAAATLAAELQPHVVLVDLSIPAAEANELLLRLAGSCAQTRAIVLASAADRPLIAESLRLGSRGAVMKNSAADVLVTCIRGVMEGMYWAGDHPVEDYETALKELPAPPEEVSPAKKFGLTRREIEIVSAVVSNYSNRQIAKKLSISEDTVKHHLTHLFDKLGVYNRLELALFAIHHGLIR